MLTAVDIHTNTLVARETDAIWTSMHAVDAGPSLRNDYALASRYAH